MNKKIYLFAIIIIAGIALTLSSCKKDEDDPVAAPAVTLTELGYDNSKIGIAGTELHIEADIVSEGTINTVTVEIHPEGEHEKNGSIILDEDHWEVDTTYTEFSGLKNTTFHKHIDIPVTADTGHYHFHFIVTDMEGQQTLVEEELEVELPDDNVAPEMTISAAPVANQEFNDGETLSISGMVSDDKALGGMYIGLVREDQNLADAEVNAMNTITLLHTHDFDSPTSHSFSASIAVGADFDNNIEPKEITGEIAWQSANYYILVKCKDAFGGNWTFSTRYPIVINY
jgi:hypothetical protein